MAEFPETVFTPATPVRDDMFATRRHERLQERVQGALRERGKQVIAYGPTGVGKTSLVRYLCHRNDINFVRVECGEDFSSMLRNALAEVDAEEVIGKIRTKSGDIEAGVMAGIFSGKGRAGVKIDTKTAQVQKSLPIMVAEALEAAEVEVLFLDNFENLRKKAHANETRQSIAEFLKSLSDRAVDRADALKVVIAGIPEASEELVTADESVARRLAQIAVTRMQEDELDQILTQGEAKLDIKFDGLCRSQILLASDGFPYYTHLIALHCSRRALNEGRDFVELSDLEGAIDEILADCDLQLRTSYTNAVETSGDVRSRRSIMEAMARLNDLEVPFREIRNSFMEIHPGRYGNPSELNFLSPPMSELRDKYDILADKGLAKSVNNLYRFRNPLMRAYIRLTMKRDSKEQLGLETSAPN